LATKLQNVFLLTVALFYESGIRVELASSIKAITPETKGAAAEVPPKSLA
jgi:hypothetical protein